MSIFNQAVLDLHIHRTSDPNDRVRVGMSGGLGSLPDPSLASVEAKLAHAIALRARFDAVDEAALSDEARLDLDLARLMLD